MTVYEIPDEPKVDALWTSDRDTGEPIEWRRFNDSNGRFVGWRRVDQCSGWSSWIEVLERGPVMDEPFFVHIN